MNILRVIVLISVVWLSSSGAQSTVEHFPGGHIRIDILIENTEAHLAEYPDDADAAINLGQLHNLAYACGWDYLSPVSTREVADRVIVAGLGLPPVHASNAVLPVSASRIKHLAEAIVLLQRGLELAPHNETGQLALGYAYMEAAKRYGSGDVIRDRVPVDEAAIEEMGERAYWENLALDTLRIARVSELQPERVAQYPQFHPAGYFIFQILAGRDSLDDIEREELAALRKQALSFAEGMTRLVSINGRPESIHNGSVSDAALAEVLAIYPFVPVNENAAEYYLRAMEAKAVFEDYDVEESLPYFGETELTLPAEPLSEASVQQIRAYLAYNAESLRLIHEGGKFSRCRFPIDMRLTHAILMPHVAQLRRLAKQKALEAVYVAETGNGIGAVDSLLDGIALSSSFRRETFLYSQLVRIGCSEIIVSAAEQVLNRATVSEGNLQKLQHAFASLENEEDIVAGIMGDRWMMTIPIVISEEELRENVIYEKAVEREGPKPPNVSTCGFGIDLPDTTGIEATDEEVKALGLKRRKENADAVKQELAEWDFILSLGQLPVSEMYLSVTKLPDAELDHLMTIEDMRKKQLQSRLKSLVAQVRLAARVRLVQTALAIERFRLRNGDIPENLEALTPDYIAADVLEDPFTGESLLYSIEEDHYVVYSVAEPRLNERYVNEGGTAPSAISFSIYF
jgi:hypothetical protein